ncbi:MAG: stage II sporulation protein R [Clostridia bacterium]|nr:stage II sporulation protein R [Clostridia bacterium]
MKITACLCAAFLLACTLLSWFPLHGEEEIYDNMIRLHVIAASDSPADQAQKLRVRDAILGGLSDALYGAADFASARDAVTAALPLVQTIAEDTAQRPVTVTLGTESYPTRQYEGFSLPAGEYTSLRVILGEGEGQNWWCVLFPRLCTDYATEDSFYEDFIAAGFSPEQYRLIKNESGARYKIRFRILELLTALWDKDTADEI